MAKQVHKEKVSREKTEAPVESKKSDTAEAAKKSADAMLDAIDDVLKEFDAEKHVKSYIQRAGE